MNNIMEQINEYEIDGLIQTMRETGIKGLMKYTDVLVLNHMMESDWIKQTLSIINNYNN
jgi:hypothetical protein